MFAATADRARRPAVYIEVFPTSPLILLPFTDALPIPKALAPVPASTYSAWPHPPGPGPGQQNSLRNERHQIWPNQIGFPDPIVYKIDLQVRTHSFTTSQVLPIDENGQPTVSFDATGKTLPRRHQADAAASTIYGFNGTFPGPMINAEYGKPALVRFENHLDENPLGLDRQDFGSPDWSFLTHLHNGHTAPESDGNPHYSMVAGPRAEGFAPGTCVDNLYLNWPAGGDDREKQSFFWFHDHRMDHTGSNVYKGMVGLYPIYDPKDGMDMGDERQGLRLPGVRTDNPDGSFDVEYDIPLAFFDCRLDDGVTIHKDIHDGLGEFPDAEQPGHAPGVVGQDVLQALPQPRLRRRHLHGQRHGLPGAGGEAAQVPLPVPRRLDRPDLRVQADELDPGPEVGGVAGLHRRRARRASTASRTASSACSSPRSPPTAGCCRSRSSGTPSSCGRPSGASSSSTSPGTRTARPPPRATSST